MSTQHRALVVIDVQNEYFDGPLQIGYPPRETSLANVGRAFDAAVAAGIPVVVVAHVDDADSPVFAQGSVGAGLHPEIEGRLSDDVLVVQKGYSSIFPETGLAEWFTEQGIDTITLVGHMANNCDLATAVEAEALGFTTEILSDATGSINIANAAGKVSAEVLHNTLMALLHSNFAAVTDTDRWIEALAADEALERSNLVESAVEGAQAFE
ncbi:cysteine hydrolase family protein [Gordonia jinhuaensis]|uniref:Isochorismatase n=1 Tax=Gordonia jinhuaensis TaxID=1517702 RepID=A0A916TEY2_9ACTN|nr:isochorismatase family protein [Gordonia jinhuaensis]GGB42399.1 isochorismatase [Gordonia jinhuaensis]